MSGDVEAGIGVDPSVEESGGGLLGVEEPQVGAEDTQVEGEGIGQPHLSAHKQLTPIGSEGKAAEEHLSIDDRELLILHSVSLIECRDVDLSLVEGHLPSIGKRVGGADVAGGEVVGDLCRDLAVSLCILLGEEGIEHLERQVIDPEVKPLILAPLGEVGE